MGVGFQNATFTDVLSAAYKKHYAKFTEQIMDNNYLFKMLGKWGLIREESGGTSIVEPLMFNTNTAVGAYREWDILDLSRQDTLTAAEFEWKYVHIPVTHSGQQTFKVSGKEKIIDLAQAKIKQSEISLDVYMDQVLLADGSGEGGASLTGLKAGIEEGSAWSVYGGIDSNVHTQWRNRWTGSVGSFATNGIDAMRSMYNSTSSGSRKPTMIVTTQAIFEYYEKTVTNIYRTMDLATADIGFRNLVYKETPMMFDDNCTAGYMYFINAEFLRLVVGKGRNFSLTPFQRPPNQDAQVASMFWYGQLTCNNRRRQGVLTGITA